MKDILGQQYPKVYLNYKRLKAALLEAWNIITDDEVRYLIKIEMKARCQTVINADGRETKY